VKLQKHETQVMTGNKTRESDYAWVQFSPPKANTCQSR